MIFEFFMMFVLLVAIYAAFAFVCVVILGFLAATYILFPSKPVLMVSAFFIYCIDPIVCLNFKWPSFKQYMENFEE